MAVRAKFYCTSITKSAWSPNKPATQVAVTFAPVPFDHANPNSENSRFWKASPSGELRLSIDNPAAVEQFEVGKEYILDFTPA